MQIGVVGRGIVGQAVAFELLRLGFDVILIGPLETDESASRCALGLASIKGLMFPRDPLFKAKFHGHYLFPIWLKSIQQQLDEKHKIAFYRDYVYEPYRNKDEYKKIRHRAFSGSYTGLFPIVDDQQQKAFHYPHDYWFQPKDLLNSLDQLTSTGAKAVYNNFFLNKIVKLNCGDYKLISDRGQEILLSAVVLAAGVNTCDILSNSNLLHLNQRRIAGHSLYANAEFLIKQSNIFAAASLNFYDDHAYFGSSSYDQSKNKTDDFREQDLIMLRRKLDELYPNDDQWQGLFGVRSLLADRRPAIGPIHDQHKRLLVATGLYKNGFALAPLIAKATGLYFKRHMKGFEPKLFKDFSPKRKEIAASL